ncbi:MAG: hypothetical protein F6K00_18660 [Leptolyngbya sp. SIOISBB]|nr:hypothetical protein [Leptolyngbya sp. SIOISBB]
MHTPAIDTAAVCDRHTPPPALSLTAEIAERPSLWQCLPLQQLTNFEVIHHQFAAQQVWFESAIVLRPSNPAFQVDNASLTLMAHARDKGFKVTLGSSITEVDFGFISSEPLTISSFDEQGHCLAIFRASATAASQPAQDAEDPVIQGVTLNTRGAKTLRIDCRAPFVLTRFWVKQAAI